MPFLLQDENFPHVISRNSGLPTRIFNLMLKIHQKLPATNDRSRLVARTYLEMILVMLINHYKGQFATAGAFDRRQRTLERLRPLFDYIDVHYPEPIALSCATSIVGMSKPHFMSALKKRPVSPSTLTSIASESPRRRRCWPPQTCQSPGLDRTSVLPIRAISGWSSGVSFKSRRAIIASRCRPAEATHWHGLMIL